MKTRMGFVSNSSSSSFVLAFHEKPESAKQLKSWMFGDDPPTEIGCYDYKADTDKVAKAVFEQLGEQLDLDGILGELTTGWLEGVNRNWNDPNAPEVWIKDENGKDIFNPAYEEWSEEEGKREVLRALEYFSKWKCPDDQVFFKVEFGDENGPFEAVCEHGDIFENIHHIRVSHH